MSEMVKRVAAAIRTEIDILLGDYSGDLCNDSIERTPEEQALAESRLEALDWLRGSWKPDATFSEERLEGVARAALKGLSDYLGASRNSSCEYVADEIDEVLKEAANPSQT